MAVLLGMASAQIIAPVMSTLHYDFDVSSLNGVPVHGEARGVNGLNFQPSVTVTVSGNRATLHRLFLDRTHHLYFGYDLLAVPEPGTARVHLSFSRLTDLAGFQGASTEGFLPGGRAVPFTDKAVRLGEPLTLPIETDDRGAVLLQDKLSFGSSLR